MLENPKKPLFYKSCDSGDSGRKHQHYTANKGKTTVAKSCDERCDSGDSGMQVSVDERTHGWLACQKNRYVPTISNRLTDGIIGAAWVLLMSQSTGKMLIKQIGEMIQDNYQFIRMNIPQDMVVINVSSDVQEIRNIRKQIEGMK